MKIIFKVKEIRLSKKISIEELNKISSLYGKDINYVRVLYNIATYYELTEEDAIKEVTKYLERN